MTLQLIALNCRFVHSCLALFYVREALSRHLPGCRTRIRQFTINDPYYDTLLAISETDADAFLFSVYIWNAAYVGRLVRDLALVRPEAPIVLGGPQAPFLSGLPPRAVVVQGPIEGLDAAFYHELKEGRPRPHYVARHGGPFPFPYQEEDFSGELKNRHIYYESSRGCPYCCSYCLSSVSRGVFHKDLDTVRRELATILAASPAIIRFVDRTFNTDPERTLELWRFLAATEGTTRFHFEIAPDRFTEEMFTCLASIPPDRFQFEMGIQSTNAETLAAVNRRMDVDVAIANIRRLAALDRIHLHADLILGLPHETAESFLEGFNRVFASRAHHIQMGLLKVLPETAIRREAGPFGLIHCAAPPYEILATGFLDHQGLGRLHAFGECVELFYNNRYFPSLWHYLRERGEDPAGFFETLLDLCRQRKLFSMASTQHLLTRALFDLASRHADRALILELLRYDWLRCGHRFLPDFLETAPPLAALRDQLWKALPQNLPGLFTYRNRDEFFKRAIFCRFSSDALIALGLHASGRDSCLCFLPEQAGGVVKHSSVASLDAP